MLGSDLVAETRLLLQSGSRPELNRLSAAMTNSQTTAVVEFAIGGIQRGAILAIELELLFVWSVTSLTATVQRGYLGTIPATHADDTLVEVNPRFADFSILRALNQEIASYSSPIHGLFRVASVDVTFSAARAGYDLTGVTDIIDILTVEAKGHLTGDRGRINRWRLIRDQAAADFASGKVLYLYEGPSPGKVIEVAYKAPFTALAALASDMTTTGLPTTAYDIPPLGAAARLVATREVRRALTDSQPEPRQAADVPPGTSRQAAGGLLALRNQRLREEAVRLQASYPALSRAAG